MTTAPLNQAAKIVVATLAFGDLPYFRFTRQINESYCGLHGYRFQILDDVDDAGRHATWRKVSGARQLLDEADFLLFMDADAYFADPSCTVESLIREQLGNASFMAGTDRRDKFMAWSDFHANVGTFLVRNDRLGHEVLESWWNAPDVYDRRWLRKWPPEQGAFNYIVRHLYSEQVIKIIPYQYMNGRDGIFIRHLVALSNAERIAVLEPELLRLCQSPDGLQTTFQRS
jgi:hypothetical protein